jgi:hypothetical protein
MRRLLLLPALAAVVAASGCGLTDTGPRTTEDRSVDAFSRIDDDGAVDVHVHVGDGPQRVRVSAGRKVLHDVRTEVRDGTLNIDFTHHGLTGGDVDVEAWVPRLAGVHADGSGDINVQGVAADAFEASADGSGDIEVAGTAGSLVASSDGSGTARLAGLAARDVRVKVGGSGDVDVAASRRLDVTVDGSGDVSYRGNPSLTQHIGGSGDVDHAG